MEGGLGQKLPYCGTLKKEIKKIQGFNVKCKQSYSKLHHVESCARNKSWKKVKNQELVDSKLYFLEPSLQLFGNVCHMSAIESSSRNYKKINKYLFWILNYSKLAWYCRKACERCTSTMERTNYYFYYKMPKTTNDHMWISKNFGN